MKFLGNKVPDYELTYSDVFIVPGDLVDIKSRMDVDTHTIDGLGTTTPVIVANMNASAGRRMAESTARRGAMTLLLQNMPIERTKKTVEYIKSRHPVFETPIVMGPEDKIQAALSLINKRAHGAVIVTDAKDKPIGVFIKSDGEKQDRYTHLKEVMSKSIISFDYKMDQRKMFDELVKEHIDLAPVTKNDKLLGFTNQH
jgi:IMP dehydrogenase